MSTNSNGSTDIQSEQYLLQLWSTQLNRPHLATHDDFFDAGGSSMQVIEMLLTVSDKYGKEIDFAEFFRNPCIHRLRELLDT
jgi:aryl carrier-like protein